MYASAKNTAIQFCELEGLNSHDINAKDVFDRAAAGNANAIKTLDIVADNLAILCVNICRVVDPEGKVVSFS